MAENKKPVLIIAEAGVNHNGSQELAFKLVDVAKAAGADIVKFQTFKADKLVTQHAEQAQYQKNNSANQADKNQSQHALLKGLELSYASHLAIKEYCDKQGIEYLSTAFEEESLRFLVDVLQLKRLKIPSGELTNTPFVLAHALTGCQLIVSTGMATLDEIQEALSAIAYGYLVYKNGGDKNSTPSLEAFKQAFLSAQGQSLLKEKVVLLHCTTEYPAPFQDVNLLAMNTMREEFGLPVGYSDHTQGIVVSVAAVAQQACVIEKHFTLNREMRGPDHKASIEPNELAQMVKEIRITEQALGRSEKLPSSAEKNNMAIARKSLVATMAIKAGERLTEENISIMRPGNGISPTKYWQVLNTKAIKNFAAGDLLETEIK